MSLHRSDASAGPAGSQSEAPEEGDIEERKAAHLDVCLHRDVTPDAAATGLGGHALEYDALPEVDLDAVDLTTTLLGKSLRAPLIIGAMTGGTARAAKYNRRLARAAARTGVAMALGSQRAMLERPDLLDTFLVRDAAPDLPLLFANIGAVQLNYGVGASDLTAAMQAVGADAINFHLNPLQEAVQPAGDTRFGGLLAKLQQVIRQLPGPALIKEVGAGISARAAAKLAPLPLAGVETAGLGGTSWAKVESYRAPAGSAHAAAGRALAGFGVATATSIEACRKAFGDRLVIASGGIRSGMDMAVAIALGADAVALAQPLLAAANESEDAVVAVIEALIYQLRVVCFCTGSANLSALRTVVLRRPASPYGARRTT